MNQREYSWESLQIKKFMNLLLFLETCLTTNLQNVSL